MTRLFLYLTEEMILVNIHSSNHTDESIYPLTYILYLCKKYKKYNSFIFTKCVCVCVGVLSIDSVSLTSDLICLNIAWVQLLLFVTELQTYNMVILSTD